jgi:hypothetical protein
MASECESLPLRFAHRSMRSARSAGNRSDFTEASAFAGRPVFLRATDFAMLWPIAFSVRASRVFTAALAGAWSLGSLPRRSSSRLPAIVFQLLPQRLQVGHLRKSVRKVTSRRNPFFAFSTPPADCAIA